ncbi:MAG TPA: hypothetical protein VJU16_06620 [Planctomycetota bacterium]|nr:hypothetical protein [Planctomycetota bacterium]
MNKALSSSLLAVVAVLAGANLVQAQPHERWKLDYSQEKPTLFTYRFPNGELENLWYVYYTVTNNGPKPVPLIIDLTMYVETGRELQADLRKVDPDAAKAAAGDSSKYEELKYGTFISNIVQSEAIEYKIIEYHAKLGNRSPGIIRQSIEELKKGDEKTGTRYYLNAREMREHRIIKDGQKLTGLAIFRNVDARAQVIEIQVSGLWDVLRIEEISGVHDEMEEVKLSYENRVYKHTYWFPGDAFHRERDVLTLMRQPTWVNKPIGPVASKSTIENLVSTLLKVLNYCEEIAKKDADETKMAESVKEKFSLNDADFQVSARIVSKALGKEFNYDFQKSLYANQVAVWRMHEWWVTNKNKLAFNEKTGKFEVKEEVLPGTKE